MPAYRSFLFAPGNRARGRTGLLDDLVGYTMVVGNK